MADNLTTATIDVRANTRGLEKDILKALKTIEFSEINTKKSSQALGRITGQVSEFNKSLEASNARVIAFGASAGAIFAVEKAFSSLISSTIDVEKKLADINVLLNVSASTIQKFGDSLFSIARNTAQSFSSVADAATELARQGLGIEETLKRTNAALILTRLSGLDAKSSVEALTATLNSFSGSALDAVEVVNKLANVDAAFAVSSADLANAISRVGSTAVDAGVSLDELIALVTSAQQTTARGGAVIGNSFKTIFTRLQRGKVQELLGSLGVDTSEGQSAVSLLQQLATTYDTLGATQKSYIAEQVGGVFQINILKAALSDLGKEYSIYGRALDTSLTSTDQAIRRNELLNQTVSALSSQAYANLEQAASKIGSLVFEPNAKGFLSGFNDLLSSFNNIDVESAGGKLMAGFFKGIGDFIGGPGAVLATAVLVKLFSRLTQFAAGSAKELLGTNKAAQQQAAIEQSILSILQKNSQFTSQILSGKMTTVQAEKELLNYLTAQSNVLREQERLSKVIGTNLRMAGVSVGASGIPMVAAAGKSKKAAASGYIPNFASDQAIGQAMENAGAKEHGYKAGKARKTRIHDGNGKSFTSFVNSKEDVKTFTNAAGKKATIVRPPNGFGENTQYAAGGFVPNFVKFSFNKADNSLAFKRKKIDKISLANFKDQKLLEDQNIADAGYDKKGKRNSIFDTVTGEVIRERFIKKERFEKVAEKQFNNYISGKNVSENAKNSFDRGLSKNYPGRSLEEVKKIILSNKEKNKKAFVGDFSNAKGALYESFVSKKIGDKYELSEDEYSRADFFAKPGSGAEYAGVEAKSGSRDLKDILFKAISSSIKNKNQDEKDDLNFGRFALYETFSSGFVPNFAYKFKKYGSEDPIREILDEKTRSFLTYADGKSDKGSPYLDMVGIHSAEKGQGLKLFSKLGKIAKRSGRRIRSSTIVPQLERLQSLDPNADLEKVLKAAYPQLLYRQRSGVKNTEFDFEYAQDSGKGIEKRLSGSNPFSLMLKSLVENGVNAKSLRENIFSRRVSVSSVEDSFAKGFVPNFASMKASDTMTRMVMEKFYPIKDAAKFKEEYSKQSFKPAALKALYRERVEGAAPSTDLSNRAAVANKITSDEAARAKIKDLGKIDYTMIHATEGSKPLSSEVVSYKKKDKKTGEETRYIASLSSASLDNKKLNNASVQQRVGDALVEESNKLSAIFNPSGGAPFSDYKQLSNSGSVMSAAGTVFESAVRQAFKVPAQGQTARIDFPNPSSQLRSFFHNAPGDYEAKISNSQDNLSSALSKYIAVKGLAKGYVPNFAKSSGLSFSQTKKDEFGFTELRAAIGGKKVGAFSYAEDKPGEVEIGDFTVDKKNRGKGYGRALYEEAIKRNKGKKMRGQLLPQMNRLLEKIKKGESVSAETLYPQIKRADLAKSSVFEVYGHKGMAIEEMTRDQFSSFVNAKINELKKDPKKLQSYFGNVEADEYGGLGIGLTTQHSSGFVPNFLDVAKGKLPMGVRGRTNYGSGGSKTNIQLGVGAEEGTLAHELFHSAYSRSTFRKAEADPGIGKFLSSPGKYTGSGMLVGDKIFKNLNKNNLIKSLGLSPVQLDFDGKNPGATYSGSRAVDEITTRIQEKVFRNKGDLSKLSADESAFIKNLEQQGIISNKRLSNVSRRSQEGSKFRNLIEGKFASVMSGASSGFVPNFASQSLISEINKRILNPNIAQKLKEGQGLKDEAYMKAASKLGVNIAGLESFMPALGFPLRGKDSIKKVSSALGFGFGRSFAIDALKIGDWDYVKSSFERNGLTKSDFDKLSQFAKTQKGETAFRWGFKSKAGGYVPNFANIFSSTRDVRKKANANQSSLNTFRVVHPLNPKIDAQGRVTFPDLEKKAKGSVKIIHNEGMDGQNVFTLPSFLDFVNSRGNKETFFRRNSFDYVLSSAGYVPNFADPLNDAINRERAAGLSKSQIYVDSHSSLKNKNNPMGLMVANTRDEPKGGIQGIKRAKKEGLNPKTYGGGMSSGYVPNFAFLKPDQEDVDALKEFTDALKKLEDDFSNPEKKAERLEKRKSRLESIPYGGVSTAETQAAESKITKAKDLRERLIQKGDMGGAQRAQALVQSAQSELSKLEKDLEKKIKDRIKSIDAQIAASKPSVEAYKAEQASLREQISSKKKEMSFGGRLKKTISNNSMGIGFGLQTAASMAGEYAGNDDTQTGRGIKAAASGFGDIASFAGTGAMIAGPWGALVGGIIGAGKGITNFIKVWNSKTPELEKALQLSSDSMNRFGESGQKILQLNEQYMDALTSGGDPAKAADIMNKTQQAYAEELSKLTETQRSAMISAIAQGKGQEAYAKVLEELQQNVKADEVSVSLQKYQESGSLVSGPDKKLIEGLDKTLAQDLTRGMDPAKIQSALDAASSSLNDFTVGTENQAVALMKSLAANASPDQQANLEQVIKSFESAAANTDLSGVAEAFIKAIQNKPAAAKSAEEAANAVKANTENLIKKQKEEVAVREATNARLLKIQAETDSIYQKFNDGIKNFIGAMETSAEMRANVGEFKSSYLSESGANKNIVDKQSEKNLVQSSNDQLQIGKYKTQFDTMQSFQSGVKEMLSGLTIDSAKANLGEAATDQGNQLSEIRLSMQQALLPIEKLIGSGDYEKAGSETERILKGLPADMKAAVGEDAIVKGIQNLKAVTEEGNRTQKDLVSNSRKDLAIQAQQLVFQKALGKLNQAQNYGGAPIKDIITNSPDTPFNQAMLALGKLKATGYSQESLQQGRTNAVQGAWKGKEKETWGVNGKKATIGMTTGLIDFYKAASQIGGESVLSTDSKDFGLLTQEVSEALRKKLEQLKIAGAGQVDPAVFTRLESTLQGLGGEDKVAQLKTMKELGFANITGKKIMDEALGGYSGGAFEGLDPQLKKAFSETSDEGTGATLLLIAGQQKQTDSLSQGLDSVSAVGIETNKLLSIQPDAIAQAIGAVLEKSRAQENYEKEISASKELDKQYADTSSQIRTGNADLVSKRQELESAKKNLEKSGVSESVYADQGQVDKAKAIVGQSLDDYLAKQAPLAVNNSGGRLSSEGSDFAAEEKKIKEQRAILTEEYNKAKAIVQASEDYKAVKQKQSEIVDTENKNKGLSEKVQQIRSQQDQQAQKNKNARVALDSATVLASQKNPLNYDRTPQTELEARKKARLDRENMYQNLSTTGPTERQLEARKISSGQKYKDIESKAVVEAGAQESQKGNIGKDKYEQRRMKAFELIDKENALPDFKRFEDVYAKLAGDKQSAKEFYDQKKAEKFGISSGSKNQKPVSDSSKSGGIPLDPNQIATAIKNMAAKGSDPKLIKDVISSSVSAGVDPSALASSLGVDPKNLVEPSAIPVDAVNETNKLLSAQPEAIASALASVLGVKKDAEQASSAVPSQSDSPQTEVQNNAKEALLSAIASAREQSATQVQPESFVDWAKKQGKVSQDFSLTSEQRTGQVELPLEIKKLRDEFLSQKGIETGYGKVVSSGPLKSRSEYEYDKIESGYVESLKPKLTGRNPKTGQPMAANMREQTQLQEYSTAKNNLISRRNYESSVEQQKREKNVEQQSAVQQEDSQALNSILGAVNQILQSVSESSGETVNTQVRAGATSVSGSSNSSSNVNITNPINISVGNETGSAAAQEIGNQVSQLVSQVMTQLEPQIRKIASEVATNVANRTVGNKPPPTQGMFA